MTNLKMTRVDMLPACPNCGSSDVVKNGFFKSAQYLLCKACNKHFKAKITLDTRRTAADIAPSPAPEPVPADMVKEPPHYKKGKIQCWDAVDSAITGLNGPTAADTAKAIEYIWRHPHKGKPVEDLEKANVYINRLIARYKGEGK